MPIKKNMRQKNGRMMSVDGQCAHQIKKKEDGRLKKKDGETPIFFKSFFGAHLLPIPRYIVFFCLFIVKNITKVDILHKN